MFKENIMKKIAGLSLAAIVMMPGVVRAAASAGTPELTNSNKTCAAIDFESFKKCVGGTKDSTADFTKVEEVNVTGDLIITESVEVRNAKVTVTNGDVTINANKTLTLTNSELVVATDAKKLTVNENAVVKVTSKENVAVSAPSVKINKGTIEVFADNSNTQVSKKNDAIALKVAAANGAAGAITVDTSILKVTSGSVEGNITASNSDVNVKDVVGTITTLKSGIVANNVSSTVITSSDDTDTSTIKVNDITGTTITLKGKAVLDANSIVGTTITLTEDTVLNAKKVIASTKVDVKDNAKALADAIDATTEVNGDKAYASYVTGNLTVTKGLARAIVTDRPGVTHIEVKMNNIPAVALNAKDTLVIKNTNEIDRNLRITGYNGATIQNDTATELNLTVNDKVVNIKPGDKAIVAGAVEKQPPVDPANPDKPNTDGSGNVLPPKNPGTGDNVVSYVAVALTSIASLGLAVKKFLF